jgi:hypothetical protein
MDSILESATQFSRGLTKRRSGMPSGLDNPSPDGCSLQPCTGESAGWSAWLADGCRGGIPRSSTWTDRRAWLSRKRLEPMRRLV